VASSEGVKHIVIVGGGLAAARTGEQLRRSEYTGRITIVSDEVHVPYDRPPLSKEVLRKEVDDVALKPREWYDEKDITLRLGSAATALDTAKQTVTLADGTALGYDELVVATGLVPRRIPAFPDLDGIRVLRLDLEVLAHHRRQMQRGSPACRLGHRRRVYRPVTPILVPWRGRRGYPQEVPPATTAGWCWPSTPARRW